MLDDKSDHACGADALAYSVSDRHRSYYDCMECGDRVVVDNYA